MRSREDAKKLISSVLKGHHEICTHNHYADAAAAMDILYDEIEEDMKQLLHYQDGKNDTIRSLCYLEGFLNGIFKAHGEDPHCKRQLDNLWNYIDDRSSKIVMGNLTQG